MYLQLPLAKSSVVRHGGACWKWKFVSTTTGKLSDHMFREHFWQGTSSCYYVISILLCLFEDKLHYYHPRKV